ncbi:MAG: ribonuclease H-like domain-containing protein [Nanoarchaeota archaeon]
MATTQISELEIENQFLLEKLSQYLKLKNICMPENPKIGYIDIETTGLSRDYHEITVIGIYDEEGPRTYINGVDMHDALPHLEQFDIVVTFNGKCFDIPFVQTISGKEYDFIHLDLRYLLKELGLAGGLKKIEKALGISRAEEVADVDGREAVRLWHQYKKGDYMALDKLLKYNREDIINLKILLNYYLDKSL